MNYPKRLAIAGLALALVAGVAACGDSKKGETSTTVASETTASNPATSGPATTSPATTDAELSGSLFISGSSTVEPISTAIAKAFGSANGSVAIQVEGPGTGD